MPRPFKIKHIGFEPDVTYFKPAGIPVKQLEKVELSMEELECIRLSDIENLSQADAASRMQIHQSTFQRTLARARSKVADALVNGRAIMIHGGSFSFDKSFRRGRGWRRTIGGGFHASKR